jgi:hypothetical protein
LRRRASSRTSCCQPASASTSTDMLNLSVLA